MTFWEIFRFEAVYQLRRASTWIYFVVLLALAFLATIGMLVEEARRGDINADAPIAVANATVFLSMIGALITAALAGDAATRDIRTRMQPLLFTAPLGKAAYLGGRFLGAFVVNALLLTAVPVGLLAARMPNREADLFGPLRLDAYLQPYLLFALPNAFVATAILFSMATWSRHALASYLGGILLFFGSVLSEEVVAEQLGKGKMGALLDPFGFTPLSELWERWTPIEKNTQLLGLDGLLLSNRLPWIAFALCVLALTHLRFRFAHLTEGGRRSNRERPGAANAANIATERSGPVAVPRVARTFDFGTRARQTLAIALSSWRDVVTGRGALVLAGVAATAVFALGTALLDDYLGTPLWPATQFVTAFLGGVFFIEVFIALLATFYAGELVWREREAGLSEIADAAPVPDGGSFRRQAPRARPGAGGTARGADGGGRARAGVPGLLRLRDRSLPARALRAPARRLSPFRLARDVRARAREPQASRASDRPPLRSLHRLRRMDRGRAPPARLRLRSGLALLGPERLRAVRRSLRLVQALLGGMGVALRRGREPVLGAR